MKQTIPLSIADFIESIEHAMTVKELAPILTLSPPTLYTRARSGLIPSYRLWGSVRFDPQAVADWIRNQAISAPPRAPQPDRNKTHRVSDHESIGLRTKPNSTLTEKQDVEAVAPVTTDAPQSCKREDRE